MKTLIQILCCVFITINFAACAGEKSANGIGADPKVVVIYGSLNSKKLGSIYYGEDTRGKLYVIEKGRFSLDLNTIPLQFVRISDFNGKWYIEKVLPNHHDEV